MYHRHGRGSTVQTYSTSGPAELFVKREEGSLAVKLFKNFMAGKKQSLMYDKWISEYFSWHVMSDQVAIFAGRAWKLIECKT